MTTSTKMSTSTNITSTTSIKLSSMALTEQLVKTQMHPHKCPPSVSPTAQQVRQDKCPLCVTSWASEPQLELIFCPHSPCLSCLYHMQDAQVCKVFTGDILKICQLLFR